MARRKRRLAQHHLCHSELCRPLVDFLRPAGGRVLEIGPGGGALTRALLAAGARVTALEIDPEWAFELGRRVLPGRLSLAVADALTLDWRRVPPQMAVAGNLPYNVATPLISAVLRHRLPGSRAAFLVQLEVARRLVATPGDRDYGSFSVLTAARAEARLLGRVKPGSFLPPPRVESAFVGLVARRPPVPESEMEGFGATVRLAFASRRKTLRNALAAGWGRSESDAVLERLGHGPKRRAEELDLEAFVALHRLARARG